MQVQHYKNYNVALALANRRERLKNPIGRAVDRELYLGVG